MSLSVGTHDFVSVVGPSGCGKSTLLRLASGLDAPPRARSPSTPRHELRLPGPHAAASGARPGATSSWCSELRGDREGRAPAPGRGGPRARRAHRVRRAAPAPAVRRHADARLARPRARRRPRARPLRRAVRRPRRDHPAADADRAAAAVRRLAASPGCSSRTRSPRRSTSRPRARHERTARAGSSTRSRCPSPYPRPPELRYDRRVRHADRPGVGRAAGDHSCAAADDRPLRVPDDAARRRAAGPARRDGPGSADGGRGGVPRSPARRRSSPRSPASSWSGTPSATSCSRRGSASCCRRRTRRSASALGNPSIIGPMLDALGRSAAVAIVGLVVAVVLGIA